MTPGLIPAPASICRPAIAVPVHSVGKIVATVSVVIPNYRVTDPELDRIGALLIRVAGEISERLGSDALPQNQTKPTD